MTDLPKPETMLAYASILEKPQYWIDPKTSKKYQLATGEIVDAACAALRHCAGASQPNRMGTEEMQNFERYPDLAVWIERLANLGVPGWSMMDWQQFTDALNAALAADQPNHMGTTPEMQKMYDEFGGDREALAKMVYEAVRFANWAAGEGFSPSPDCTEAIDPAIILSDCINSIEHFDGDDWNRLAGIASDAILSATLAATPGEDDVLRDALGQIAGKNDLSGVPDDDLESAARNALYECELIARAALAAMTGWEPVEWHWRTLDDDGKPNSKWFVVDGSLEEFKRDMQDDSCEFRQLYAAQPASQLRGRELEPFAKELERQEKVRSYRDGDCYLADCRLTIGELRRLVSASPPKQPAADSEDEPGYGGRYGLQRRQPEQPTADPAAGKETS